MTLASSSVHGVFRVLRRHRDALVTEVVGAIQHREPAYRFTDERLGREWAQGVGDMVDMVLSAVPRNREGLTPTEAVAVRATGAARADQGIPLRSVLCSVREARRVLMAAVYCVVSTSDTQVEPGTLADVDRLVGLFAADIEDSLREGWTARHSELAARADHALARTIDRLFAGPAHACNEAAAELIEHGWDLFGGSGLFLAEQTPETDSLLAEIRKCLGSVLIAPRTSNPSHVAFVVPAGDVDSWRGVLARVRMIAAARGAVVLAAWPCRDPEELHDRYAAAVPVVQHLHRLGAGQPVVDSRELAVAQLVASSSQAARRVLERDVYDTVSSVPDPGRTQLEETLSALVRHGLSVKAAARSMAKNVKTLYGTRSQLENALAISFKDGRDVARIVVAVHAHELRNSVPVEPRKRKTSTSDDPASSPYRAR